MIKRSNVKAIGTYLFVTALGLVLAYPLLWLVSASFKTDSEIFSGINFWPKDPTLFNYVNGWKGLSGYSYGVFFSNTLFLCVVCMVGVVFSCSLAAYAFSKLQFRLKNVMFSIMMISMMLPGYVTLIPQYIVYNNLKWVNTYAPLTIPAFFATNGFLIFLMVQFMRNISNEMLEAPRIDGCGTFRIYWHFVMPLSIPALMMAAVFTFIGVWNDYFGPMLYLQSPRLYTVALALRSFIDSTGTSAWGSLFAMSLLSLIPLFFIFVGFQRYLIEGLAAGALKG